MGVTVPLNQSQKIATIEINDRIVLQPHVWYTCPAGKRAIVKGCVQCTSRGAAATADFIAAGVVMFRWNNSAANSGSYLEVPRGLTTAEGGQFAEFEVELSAGDTIVTDQDAGTNAEFNVWATVQETPT